MASSASKEEILSKGRYLIWSRNGTGPHAYLETLVTHYANLSEMYKEKGMEEESAMFAEVAAEFALMKKELRELLESSQASR